MLPDSSTDLITAILDSVVTV